ncbi:MAG: CaiB/BaiF CoA-transferase family protein [Syntrophaceae bacterium]
MSEARKPRAGPLVGTRVLDLTRLFPGPLATMLLAEMGAEVIKIEDPKSPDPMRMYPPFTGSESALYLAVNRSKRSIAVDYTGEAGRGIILDLARGADVFIEQFRPGYLDTIGLGYTDIYRVNTKIVFVSLTGYGQSGAYSAQAGHDINYIGYTGLSDSTGDDLGPAVPAGQVADVAGSYATVVSCLAALLNRDKTGKGQRADVSMLDAALPYMIVPLAEHFAGSPLQGRGRKPLTGGMPCYGIYECADKKYVALGAIEEKFWKRFCEAIESPDLLPLQYSLDGNTVKKEMAAVFRTRTRDEWMAVAAGRDFCLTPVLEIDQIENDPHLRDRCIFIEQSHPVYGTTKGIGPPIKFSETAAASAWAAPLLGEDTIAILRELGYDENRIEGLLQSGTVRAGAD